MSLIIYDLPLAYSLTLLVTDGAHWPLTTSVDMLFWPLTDLPMASDLTSHVLLTWRWPILISPDLLWTYRDLWLTSDWPVVSAPRVSPAGRPAAGGGCGWRRARQCRSSDRPGLEGHQTQQWRSPADCGGSEEAAATRYVLGPPLPDGRPGYGYWCAQCSLLSAHWSVLTAQCSLLSAHFSVLTAQWSLLVSSADVVPRARCGGSAARE